MGTSYPRSSPQVVAHSSSTSARAPTYVVRMVPAARWLVVALLALAVCAPPTVLRLLPASDTDVSGRRSSPTGSDAAIDTGWSGEVRTQGSL